MNREIEYRVLGLDLDLETGALESFHEDPHLSLFAHFLFEEWLLWEEEGER